VSTTHSRPIVIDDVIGDIRNPNPPTPQRPQITPSGDPVEDLRREVRAGFDAIHQELATIKRDIQWKRILVSALSGGGGGITLYEILGNLIQ